MACHRTCGMNTGSIECNINQNAHHTRDVTYRFWMIHAVYACGRWRRCCCCCWTCCRWRWLNAVYWNFQSNTKLLYRTVDVWVKPLARTHTLHGDTNNMYTFLFFMAFPYVITVVNSSTSRQNTSNTEFNSTLFCSSLPPIRSYYHSASF